MQTNQNLGIDPEDLGDVLVMLEKSFDFKFKDNELAHVKNYGELCGGRFK
jgi:acyl carrier protein